MKQKIRDNQKGMTLVELVVALAILMMVLLSAASVFIAAQRYYNKTAETNLNKLSADAVYNFITDRLTYAGQVFVFQEPEPDLEAQLGGSWHSIRISDEGRLLFDNKDVYGETYYRGRSLSMVLQPKGYRVSLSISLSDGQEGAYQTESTLLLLNLQAAQAKVETTYMGSEHSTIFDSTLTSPKLYLYYNTFSTVTPETTTQPRPTWPTEPGWPFQITGTVADEIKHKTPENTITDYELSKTEIKEGQFFLYNGELYRCIKDTMLLPEILPGATTSAQNFWKKIQIEWDPSSSYSRDDVVKYGSNYYRSLIPGNNLTIFDDGSPLWRPLWEEVKADLDKSTNETIVWIPV